LEEPLVVALLAVVVVLLLRRAIVHYQEVSRGDAAEWEHDVG
jgi:hypothetical protein